jgi:hypothetical protein
MGFNGTGTFVINSSGQPVVAGTVIDATVINALTADIATGLSTCLTKDNQTAATSRISFANGINSTLTTDATSISTGSILTAGGLSVQKAVWIGGLVNIAGALTLQSTITIAGAITSSLTTDSSSISTGAIISAGGVGIAKALWVGGLVNIAGVITASNATQSTSQSTGSVILTGGLGVAKRINAGADIASASQLVAGTNLVIGTTAQTYAFWDGFSFVVYSDSGYRPIDCEFVKIGGSPVLTVSALSLAASDSGLDLSNGTTVLRMASDGRMKLTSQTSIVEVAGNIGIGGLTANDVFLKKTGNFELSIRKGNDSGLGDLRCSILTPSILNYTFGGQSTVIDVLTNGGGHTVMTFADGLWMS